MTRIVFRIDKTKHVVSRVKFFLDDGTSVRVMLRHAQQQHAGDAFPVLTASQISIKGPGIKYGNVSLPEAVTFRYENYRFK